MPVLISLSFPFNFQFFARLAAVFAKEICGFFSGSFDLG
jgi:hypothetical protein